MGHLSQFHVIIAQKAKVIAHGEGAVSSKVQCATLDPKWGPKGMVWIMET